MTFSPLWFGFCLAASIGITALPPVTREKGGTVIPAHPGDRVEILARNGYDAPDGLLWRPEGLYVADEGGGRLRLWTAEKTHELHARTKQVQSPEDVVSDAAGNLYFTDDTTGGVFRRSVAGEFKQIAGPAQGLKSTEGIAVTPEGTILVGDGELHTIFEIGPAGEVTKFATDIRKPESMVFDEHGGLYVADNEDNVIYYLLDQKWRVVLKDPEISPETIIYSNGALLVTDSQSGRLYRFVRGERPEVLLSLGGNMRKIQGVTVDGQGVIYLSIQTDLKNKKGYILRLTPA
ncbi:MAG: hypothetical protein K2X03_24555 [Bryobacteraceae bacterium]|nr:hypothetical protein [Bryobacteraceae bacterium]